MTRNIPRKDEPSRRFISLEEKLEILDRLRSADKLTFLFARNLARNESTIRTIRKSESKIRAGASAGASSILKKFSRYERSFINKNRKLFNYMDGRLQGEECSYTYLIYLISFN